MTRRTTGGSAAAGASRLLFLALLGALPAPVGCRPSAPPGAAPEPGVAAPAAERLAPTWGSPEEVAEAFLDALARSDVEGIRSMALDEEEFSDVVWPELPSSRPERNLPRDYAWRDLRQKSLNSLSRTVHEHGGKRYRLERVEFLTATTEYTTFEVHREARLVLVDHEGRLRRWRLFGSMIERGGRFKLFSFVDDD